MGDKLTPEELAEFREIFNLVDKDGGGTISKEELGELMETLGIDATPEEIDFDDRRDRRGQQRRHRF